MIKTGIVSKSLSKENFKPKKPISKVSIGILAALNMPTYTKIFRRLQPFFHNSQAKGKAT